MQKKLLSLESSVSKYELFSFLGVLLAFLISFEAVAAPQVVDWAKFAEFEPWKNAKLPEALSKINKKEIKLPGFMMPLEIDGKNTTQFLLVPSLPACAHVPPPPPNLTVMVKVKKGSKALMSDDPVWVIGILKVIETNKKPQMGDALYEIEASKVEAYK